MMDVLLWLFFFISENFLILLALFFIIAIIWIFILNYQDKKEWEEMLRDSGITDIDQMTGEIFEEYLGRLLKARGYKVRSTPSSRDYGADLVISDGLKTIVVQAKRYQNKVGLRAVQEVVSAKNYYEADECWVVTNNYYTAPAMNLAATNHVVLIDRDMLVEWIIEEKDKGEATTSV